MRVPRRLKRGLHIDGRFEGAGAEDDSGVEGLALRVGAGV
jgi:hypothetical protein